MEYRFHGAKQHCEMAHWLVHAVQRIGPWQIPDLPLINLPSAIVLSSFSRLSIVTQTAPRAGNPTLALKAATPPGFPDVRQHRSVGHRRGLNPIASR